MKVVNNITISFRQSNGSFQKSIVDFNCLFKRMKTFEEIKHQRTVNKQTFLVIYCNQNIIFNMQLIPIENMNY